MAPSDAVVKQKEREKVAELCEEEYYTAPSVGNTIQQIHNNNDCTFKKEGMYKIHGIVGTTFKVTKKVWTDLNN